MSRGSAQAVTASLSVTQTVTIDNPVEGNSSAQSPTVTMGTNYIFVAVNPAMKLPTV